MHPHLPPFFCRVSGEINNLFFFCCRWNDMNISNYFISSTFLFIIKFESLLSNAYSYKCLWLSGLTRYGRAPSFLHLERSTRKRSAINRALSLVLQTSVLSLRNQFSGKNWHLRGASINSSSRNDIHTPRNGQTLLDVCSLKGCLVEYQEGRNTLEFKCSSALLHLSSLISRLAYFWQPWPSTASSYSWSSRLPIDALLAPSYLGGSMYQESLSIDELRESVGLMVWISMTWASLPALDCYEDPYWSPSQM